MYIPCCGVLCALLWYTHTTNRKSFWRDTHKHNKITSRASHTKSSTLHDQAIVVRRQRGSAVLTITVSSTKPFTSITVALTVSSASETMSFTCWLVRNAKTTPTLDGMGKVSTCIYSEWMERVNFISTSKYYAYCNFTGERDSYLLPWTRRQLEGGDEAEYAL